MHGGERSDFRRLGELLREQRTEILREFERLDRQQTDSARKLTRRELLNRLPNLLDEIIARAEGAKRDRPGLSNAADLQEHARHRHSVGYSLEEVTVEYAVLRTSVLQCLASRGTALALEEIRLLDNAIDEAVLEGVTEYVEVATRELEEERTRLAQSERRLRLILDAVPQPICLIDDKGCYRLANRVYEEWFHLPPAEMVGRSVREVLGEENYAYAGPLIERALRGEVVSAQVPFDFRGQRGVVDATVVPERSEEGDVVGCIAVVQDVSTHAREMAEERRRADLEKQLIGIVSHDLRNPITAIIVAAAHALRRADLDERTRQSVSLILSAGERAARMIHTLLDFTRARLGGGIPVERRPVDLHALANEVVAQLRLAFPRREIRLELEGDARGEFDGDRIAQVLENLTCNALVHGAADGLVTVRLRGDGDRVEASVHNFGPTIPPEAAGRIFEPMTRGREASGGLGIGLFVVKHITLAHGGTVDVDSSPAAGTTFTVKLPRHAGAPATPRNHPGMGGASPGNAPPQRI